MLLVFLVLEAVAEVAGHGRLWDPPSRSTMFRRGYRTPANYDDNQLYCGGFARQWGTNGGKCGQCGDPWDGSRQNEAGGRYATGTISRRYRVGQIIEIDTEVTANHKGWFEFKLCPTNNYKKKASKKCFDRFLLNGTDGVTTRHMVPLRTGHILTNVKLPENLECSQCVLQWKYHAGNSWGASPGGGGCLGCGPQEEFVNCADISIGDKYMIKTTPVPPKSGRTTTPPQYQLVPSGAHNHSAHIFQPAPLPSNAKYIGLFMTPVLNPGPQVFADRPQIVPLNLTPPEKKPIETEHFLRTCAADGAWKSSPSMTDWCNLHCNRGFCPIGMCRCF